MSDYEPETPIHIESDIDTITVRMNGFTYDDGDAVMAGRESANLYIDTHTHAQTASVWEAIFSAGIRDYVLSFEKNPETFAPDTTYRGRFHINAKHGLAGVYIQSVLEELEISARSDSVDERKVFA